MAFCDMVMWHHLHPMITDAVGGKILLARADTLQNKPVLAFLEDDGVGESWKSVQLTTTWNFWKDLTKPHNKVGMKTQDFAKHLQETGHFNTIRTLDDIWPARTKNLRMFSNLRIFRDSIKPLWEVPQNRDGGKFVIIINKPDQAAGSTSGLNGETSDLPSSSTIHGRRQSLTSGGSNDGKSENSFNGSSNAASPQLVDSHYDETMTEEASQATTQSSRSGTNTSEKPAAEVPLEYKLCLAYMILGLFGPVQEFCGCVLSIRAFGSMISIWVSSSDDDVVDDLRSNIASLLKLPIDSITYQKHNESIKNNSRNLSKTETRKKMREARARGDTTCAGATSMEVPKPNPAVRRKSDPEKPVWGKQQHVQQQATASSYSPSSSSSDHQHPAAAAAAAHNEDHTDGGSSSHVSNDHHQHHSQAHHHSHTQQSHTSHGHHHHHNTHHHHNQHSHNSPNGHTVASPAHTSQNWKESKQQNQLSQQQQHHQQQQHPHPTNQQHSTSTPNTSSPTAHSAMQRQPRKRPISSDKVTFLEEVEVQTIERRDDSTSHPSHSLNNNPLSGIVINSTTTPASQASSTSHPPSYAQIAAGHTKPQASHPTIVQSSTDHTESQQAVHQQTKAATINPSIILSPSANPTTSAAPDSFKTKKRRAQSTSATEKGNKLADGGLQVYISAEALYGADLPLLSPLGTPHPSVPPSPPNELTEDDLQFLEEERARLATENTQPQTASSLAPASHSSRSNRNEELAKKIEALSLAQGDALANEASLPSPNSGFFDASTANAAPSEYNDSSSHSSNARRRRVRHNKRRSTADAGDTKPIE